MNGPRSADGSSRRLSTLLIPSLPHGECALTAGILGRRTAGISAWERSREVTPRSLARSGESACSQARCGERTGEAAEYHDERQRFRWAPSACALGSVPFRAGPRRRAAAARHRRLPVPRPDGLVRMAVKGLFSDGTVALDADIARPEKSRSIMSRAAGLLRPLGDAGAWKAVLPEHSLEVALAQVDLAFDLSCEIAARCFGNKLAAGLSASLGIDWSGELSALDIVPGPLTSRG
jgi:hypothetical protein